MDMWYIKTNKLVIEFQIFSFLKYSSSLISSEIQAANEVTVASGFVTIQVDII